jgi:RNA polymerase sigma factor (sigma-70 family)
MEVLRLNDFSSSKLDDPTIVKRVIAGEKELFEIILRRYNQTLYRVIRGYLKDTGEVQDAMQNTYLKAYDKLFQFRGDSAFSTWLIRIGINEALLQLRIIRKERSLYGNGADPDREEIKQIPDKQMNPEMLIINQEGERLVELAIDSLPEKYRVIYILKEVEGLANREIAECLGITDENVKVRLHRANRLLKDGLFQLTSNVKVLEFGNSSCDAIVNLVMRDIG